MVSLLATVISFGLTALASAIGIFYLGATFTGTGGKLNATNLAQALQQINTAWYLYEASGGTLPTVGKFVTGSYLTSPPPGVSGLTKCLAADVPARCTVSGALSDLATHYQVYEAGALAARKGVYIVLSGASALETCWELSIAGGQLTTDLRVGGTPIYTATTQGDFDTAFFMGVRFGCVRLSSAGATTVDGLTISLAENTATLTATNYLAFYLH
ncbi:putative Type 4 secretion system PilS N-terminal domain-containing protein [uncultured Gammaproteobacteria bacterium]